MNHTLTKIILISKVSELISNKYHITIDEARDRLYDSDIVSLLDDEKSGLYGESPLYIFSLYEIYNKK